MKFSTKYLPFYTKICQFTVLPPQHTVLVLPPQHTVLVIRIAALCLQEYTRIGRPGTETPQDIQLRGLGIANEHCVIEIVEKDVFITPMGGARYVRPLWPLVSVHCVTFDPPGRWWMVRVCLSEHRSTTELECSWGTIICTDWAAPGRLERAQRQWNWWTTSRLWRRYLWRNLIKVMPLPGSQHQAIL